MLPKKPGIKPVDVSTSMPGDDGKDVAVVNMEYLLDRDVDFRLYKYLTES